MRVLVEARDAALGAELRRHGHIVLTVAPSQNAQCLAEVSSFDAIILSALIGDDALETLRRLRARGVSTPILLVTRPDPADRIAGLDAGADDCLSIPVAIAELLARLRAVARRCPFPRSMLLACGALRLDPVARHVERAGRTIELSATDFRLLETFMRHPGIVLSRATLFSAAWENGQEDHSNIVEQHIVSLRQRIDRPFGVQTLQTIRGRGYRLLAED
jgi:two-component system OmpR family response regulator